MFCLTISAAAPQTPARTAATSGRSRSPNVGLASPRTARMAQAMPNAMNGAAISSPLTITAPPVGVTSSAPATAAAHVAARRAAFGVLAVPAAARPTPTTVRATTTQPSRRSAVNPPRASASRKNPISNGGRSTQYGPYSEPPPGCQCCATTRNPPSSGDIGARR